MEGTAHNMLVESLPDSPLELSRLLDAVVAKMAVAPLSVMSDPEVLETVETLEKARRRADGLDAALYVEVNDREVFGRVGHKRAKTFYAQYLRLGETEAKRRGEVAKAIGRLTAMTGAKLPPKREPVAASVAAGIVSGHHVREIEKIMDMLPREVAAPDVADAVDLLDEAAADLAPEDLRGLGQRILAHLDPDGILTDERDRRRQRGLTIGRQDARLMSRISGCIGPQLRAKLEVLLDNWARPGMNNPDDEQSLTGSAAELTDDDRKALCEAALRDGRSTAQRNHDALERGLDWILGHGALGRPDRLPAQLVITVDEPDLARRAGVALTATGTMVPVADLVDLAADAVPWLEVFKRRTRQVLDFYRGARIATKAQRLALFGAHRGCTRPGCPRPFSQCQIHHAALDFAKGGLTNLDQLAPACGVDNRNVGEDPGQWETTIIDTGTDAGLAGWRLVGSGGPYRTNPINHPRRMPAGEDDEPGAVPDRSPSLVEAALEARLAAAS
ncbi:DUF222 domain-containing protein [Gordonia sp. (in: high G+C Gram-positive bacteria)]|uniref:HNH endonuclease signature motif containing protein n=1 Tax=Gordonia sp. (in: high G+C Gram-positive bacteria) TaxID=84139 RepID=UPI0039E22019